MLDRGVRTFCVDAPSIDPTPDKNLAAHLLIADACGVIGENFRNLELVDWPDPFVSCLPIKLAGADGAPVRAVAGMETSRRRLRRGAPSGTARSRPEPSPSVDRSAARAV